METHVSDDKRHHAQQAHEHMHTRTVGVPQDESHGSRVVGIEGQFDDERLRHRNTGAKMVMDGCSNGDRVDEVRVGHVRHVDGRLAWCCAHDLSGSWALYGHEKKFQVWQKVSDVVIFGVIYLLN